MLPEMRANCVQRQMALREDALRRILSLDSGRSAQLALRLAQDQVQARSGAVLAIEGEHYVLCTASELEQRDLGRIASVWEKTAATLLTGQAVICKEWALVPIGRPATCLLYLGEASVPISGVIVRQLRDELGDLLALAMSVRAREPEMQVLHEMQVQHLPLHRIAREKLLLVLRACGWNKTRAAEALHVTRATLYKWMDRHGIKEPA